MTPPKTTGQYKSTLVTGTMLPGHAKITLPGRTKDHTCEVGAASLALNAEAKAEKHLVSFSIPVLCTGLAKPVVRTLPVETIGISSRHV